MVSGPGQNPGLPVGKKFYLIKTSPPPAGGDKGEGGDLNTYRSWMPYPSGRVSYFILAQQNCGLSSGCMGISSFLFIAQTITW